MATSRILEIADAMVSKIRELSIDNGDVVVCRTYDPWFDADKQIGLNVFVVPLADEPFDPSRGGDRGHDPFLYRFGVVFRQRMSSEVLEREERDEFLDEFVDYVTVIRDWFDESRDFQLVDGVPLVPVETGTREVYNVAEWVTDGVASSDFTTAIREG